MKNIWILIVCALLAFTGSAQELAITADGISLNAEETERLAVKEEARTRNVRATSVLIKATVRWVDTVAPEVLDGMSLSAAQRTNLEGRIANLRTDLILLAGRRIEQLQAARPSGVTVRQERLEEALGTTADLAALEQGRLDALPEDAEPAQVQARQDALAAAVAARDAAQAELDAFNAAHPEE